MKTLFTVLILVFSSLLLKAQDDMTTVWETKLNHKVIYHGTDLSDRPDSYSFAADDKKISVFKNADGSTIWTSAYKDIAPRLRKVDELEAFWESNTIFLFDRKLGKDQIACIDMKSGELLWTTDKYQDVTEESIVYIPEEEGFAITLKKELVFIKARTGEEVWNTAKFRGTVGKYIYNSEDRTLVMVNFMPSGLMALFTGFKNQIVRMNMSTGEILWENNYIGRAEKKVLTGEFIFDLELVEDKVFLRINGIQVYDYNTGAALWSAAFDFTADVVNMPSKTRKSGVYGAVAEPVVIGNDVYVLDMSDKKNQYVKKYDLQTGRLLWTSYEIKGARVIPSMNIINDKVLLQIGGRVETQYFRSYWQGDTHVQEWVVDFPEVKPFGVEALNASDGTLAWESEKFRKGITNAIQMGDDYIVSSGKSLYKLDIATGNDIFEVPVSKGGVGQASLILPYKEDIVIVIGEKGVSTFNANSGDLLTSGKYKTSSLFERFEDLVIMKTDKADVAAFDVDTGKYKEFKARKDAGFSLTNDGDHLFVYEKKVVTKLKTR